MRAFLQNFLSDEQGTFHTEIDLYQHGINTGIAVTDVIVQEVARLIPGLKSLKLTNCMDITDAGIWYMILSLSLLSYRHIFLSIKP